MKGDVVLVSESLHNMAYGTPTHDRRQSTTKANRETANLLSVDRDAKRLAHALPLTA
jgi:hypothetical protein